MAKKIVEPELKELRQHVQAGNVVIGKDTVLKGLRQGELKTIYMAKNCPLDVKEDITHYTSLSKTPVIGLEMSNEELGIFCKKNFFVSVLGVK